MLMGILKLCYLCLKEQPTSECYVNNSHFELGMLRARTAVSLCLSVAEHYLSSCLCWHLNTCKAAIVHMTATVSHCSKQISVIDFIVLFSSASLVGWEFVTVRT